MLIGRVTCVEDIAFILERRDREREGGREGKWEGGRENTRCEEN